MPTYESNSSAPQLPKCDYKMRVAPVPEGTEPKSVSVDFSTKPVAWLYKNSKDGIYGTMKLVLGGKEYKFKIYLSPNNYQPAAVAAPQHDPMVNDESPF